MSELIKKLEVNDSLSVSLTPWFESGYRLRYLKITEELGGSLASGFLDLESMKTEESLKKITRQFTGKLTIEKAGGNTYEIDIFIYKKQFAENRLKLSFYCIKNKDFYTKRVMTDFDDITKAIDFLYPGKKDIRCKTNIKSPITLFQNNLTNLEYCTLLANSFLKNIVFGFTWDSFLLKERIGIDSNGDKEPTKIVVGGLGSNPKSLYIEKYDTLLYEQPYNSWEPDEENKKKLTDYSKINAINNRTTQLYDNYVTVGTDYLPMMENYLYNTTQNSLDMFLKVRLLFNDLPNYRLGDVINYRKPLETEIPYTTFLVRKNELVITNESNITTENGSNLAFASTLIALNRFDSILPEDDPLEEMNEDGEIPE